MSQHGRPTSATRRLLYVTTVPGTFHFLLPYVEHFAALGWQVDALTGDGEVSAPLRSALNGIHRVSWSRRPHDRGNATALRQVRSVLARGRYDVVHTHTPIASFVTRLAAARLPADLRPALVYTAHGFHFHPGGARLPNVAYGVAEKLAGLRTDRLIVINEADYRAARRLRIVAPDRLVHLPGVGIDLQHFRRTPELEEAAAHVREELALPPGGVLLGVVAEMIARKNHAAALEALARSERADLHLCLAGNGPLRAELEALAHSRGIADRVHFLGVLSDVRALVLSCAATVLPSRQEGLSRAVMESLALGVPVIGGRVRGISDLVVPDGGVVVPPDDVTGLAAAFDRVEQLKRGNHLLSRLQPRLETLSIENLLRDHEELYEDLVSPVEA